MSENEIKNKRLDVLVMFIEEVFFVKCNHHKKIVKI